MVILFHDIAINVSIHSGSWAAHLYLKFGQVPPPWDQHMLKESIYQKIPVIVSDEKLK